MANGLAKKQIDNLIKQAEGILQQAGDLALKEFLRMVQDLIAAHKGIQEFRMGMGTCYVMLKKNEERLHLEDRQYMKHLHDFLTEYDSKFQLTGIPVMVRDTGEIMYY